MASKERQGLSELENELSRAGIKFEIRGNPVTAALGIARFELHVDQADLPEASHIWEAIAAGGVPAKGPKGLQFVPELNGFDETAESDLEIEAQVVPEEERDDRPNPPPEAGDAGLKSELAQATALLEEEVEALLARETEFADRCSSLEEKVQTLDGALAGARTDLAREVTNRSAAEKQLAEMRETRVSLEKEVQSLKLRLKASEQALAASQSQLQSQVRAREQLAKERLEEQRQTQASLGTVNDLRSQIRARMAAHEKKELSPAEKRGGNLSQKKNPRSLVKTAPEFSPG